MGLGGEADDVEGLGDGSECGSGEREDVRGRFEEKVESRVTSELRSR